MKLKSEIIVKQSVEDVTKFFEESTNLAKWDRSVAKVVVTTPGTLKVGSMFDTISPSGMKMSYRMIEYERGKIYKILLTNSRIFKSAIWQTTVDVVLEGTRITASVDIVTRLVYSFLIPILYINRKAILRDLQYLKEALNEN